MKKMVLLEEGEVERLRQKQIKEYDPTLGAMARAQIELEAVLGNHNLSDEEKLNLLNNVQQKFKKLKSSIGVIPVPATTTILNAVPEEPPKATEDTDIAYEKFKEFISHHPRVIRSNQLGELVYNNRVVPDSSFHQIMESMLSGTNFNLPGLPQFVQGLRSIKAPISMFNNEQFRALLTPSSPLPKVELKSESTPALDVSRFADSPTISNRTRSKRSQTGKGGKRPRIIWLYQ